MQRLLYIAETGRDVPSVSSQDDVAIEHVATWDDALTRLHGAHGFDLVVFDWPESRSPDGDDTSRIDALCEHPSGVPVLAVVGNESQGEEALQYGVHGYLESTNERPLRPIARHALELSRARRSLRETRARLLHADRLTSLGRLTSGVMHEISNPLASLRANLTILRDPLPRTAEWAGIVSDSITAIDHIASLTDRLRRFSRAEVEGSPARRSPVGHTAIGHSGRHSDGHVDRHSDGHVDRHSDISRAIGDACMLTMQLVRRHARLVTDLQDGVQVSGDHGELVQVFTNLLANAAQAIEGPAMSNMIRITSQARDGAVVVAVEDTGVGIAEADAELIFEPYFTTKAPDTGTGLGLALAAEIVRGHGGAISARPRATGGTRFEVRLPLATPKGPEVIAELSGPMERSSPTSRVLLVDDEPGLLKAFCRLLSPRHEIVTASDGGQALDILAEDTAFDGVVCDFSMPGVDGIALYQAVAEFDRELAGRIVFCTGGPMSRRGQRFIASTSNTVLVKPVPPDRLIGAIEQLGKR